MDTISVGTTRGDDFARLAGPAIEEANSIVAIIFIISNCFNGIDPFEISKLKPRNLPAVATCQINCRIAVRDWITSPILFGQNCDIIFWTPINIFKDVLYLRWFSFVVYIHKLCMKLSRGSTFKEAYCVNNMIEFINIVMPFIGHIFDSFEGNRIPLSWRRKCRISRWEVGCN